VALVKTGNWIINTRYIQYVTIVLDGVLVTLGEGASVKTVSLSKEGWVEFKDNIAKVEAGPPR
jgi:hypothetical protein